MKRVILRVDDQSWNNKLKPYDYLVNIGVVIVKCAYSNFSSCYFFEVESDKTEFIDEIAVLNTTPSKFNWNI